MKVFENPMNGYKEQANSWFTWLWCLLFGPFYFAARGNWPHFFISLVLALLTVGISLVIYPIFAYGINVRFFEKNGWRYAGRTLSATGVVDPVNKSQE